MATPGIVYQKYFEGNVDAENVVSRYFLKKDGTQSATSMTSFMKAKSKIIGDAIVSTLADIGITAKYYENNGYVQFDTSRGMAGFYIMFGTTAATVGFCAGYVPTTNAQQQYGDNIVGYNYQTGASLNTITCCINSFNVGYWPFNATSATVACDYKFAVTLIGEPDSCLAICIGTYNNPYNYYMYTNNNFSNYYLSVIYYRFKDLRYDRNVLYIGCGYSGCLAASVNTNNPANYWGNMKPIYEDNCEIVLHGVETAAQAYPINNYHSGSSSPPVPWCGTLSTVKYKPIIQYWYAPAAYLLGIGLYFRPGNVNSYPIVNSSNNFVNIDGETYFVAGTACMAKCTHYNP